MNNLARFAALSLMGVIIASHQAKAAEWISFEGKEGPGKGKNIVFVTGDEEYRSEEAAPMLAKILAERHGFNCTVLFCLNPQTGTIDPNNQTNLVGLSHLQNADMMVIFTRFREPSDDQMKYVAEFVNSGKPIFGIRTATHAFDMKRNKQSPYFKYDWQSKEWLGGFGQQILGETWVNHWGNHGKQSTRGVINETFKDHPILRGVTDIWGPTDVYEARHLPKDASVLVWGQILQGMHHDDPPLDGPKNNPMMPIIWVRPFTGDQGKTSRIICSTIGAATDLNTEDLRRLFINACYWGLGLEDQIPAKNNAQLVGPYNPTNFGFNGYVKGVKPEDFLTK